MTHITYNIAPKYPFTKYRTAAAAAADMKGWGEGYKVVSLSSGAFAIAMFDGDTLIGYV